MLNKNSKLKINTYSSSDEAKDMILAQELVGLNDPYNHRWWSGGAQEIPVAGGTTTRVNKSILESC